MRTPETKSRRHGVKYEVTLRRSESDWGRGRPDRSYTPLEQTTPSVRHCNRTRLLLTLPVRRRHLFYERYWTLVNKNLIDGGVKRRAVVGKQGFKISTKSSKDIKDTFTQPSLLSSVFCDSETLHKSQVPGTFTRSLTIMIRIMTSDYH